MTSPALDSPFDIAYDAVSCHSDDVPSNSGCYVYKPDNYDDYSCIAIWQPAPELGARTWTRFGRRILIGVYKDEGRPVSYLPPGLGTLSATFVLADGILTVTCAEPHGLLAGDFVDVSGTPAPIRQTVLKVVSATTFTTATTGANGSGACLWRPVRVDFSETHVVFRLLPTFTVVPVQVVRDILAAADPQLSRRNVSLTNILTGQETLTSEVQTYTSNVIYRRHRQQLSESSKPLPQRYDARGRVIPIDLRFSRTANAKLYLNAPNVSQHNPLPTSNATVPVFDYYGFQINDVARGPYYAADLVTYDSSSVTGIKRKTLDDVTLYTGPLHDEFGNFVIGVRANNTTIVRQPVQPLFVDHHGTPYKAPYRSA